MLLNNRFKQTFLEKYKDYFMLLGTIFALFVFVMSINNCFPFGSDSLLVSDSYTQIGPMIEYMYGVFDGDFSLFYTNILAGGVELFSTIQYMLMSPFYLVCFLVKREHCFQMLNVSILLMILFNAFIFVWFSRKYFKNINFFNRFFIGFLFVFSGFLLLNYGFITWIIYPGILLLMIDTFFKLVKQKKILNFTLILIWYVLNCFSVGIFSNLILLILFYIYTMFMVEKNERKQVLVNLSISYLIAIIVCLVVLVPSIYAMLSGDRMGNLIDIWKGFSAIHISSFNGIFLDAVFVIFAINELIKIYKKEKCSNLFKTLIISFCVLIFPCLFSHSLNLLAGGYVVGFRNRFYFIFMIYFLLLTMRHFDEDIKIQENYKNKKSNIINFGIISFVYFIMLSIFFVNIKEISVETKSPLNNSPQLTVFLLILFLSYFTIFMISLFFTKRKIITQKIFKINVSLILLISSICNFLVLSNSIKIENDNSKEINNLVEELNIDGKVKPLDSFNSLLLNDIYFKNDLFFSSLISKNTIDSFKSLGYSTVKTALSLERNNGNLISDSLTAQKYYISEEEQNRPYLKLIKKADKLYLYENLLASSGAVLFDKNYFYENDKSPMENLEKINSSFGFSEKLFSKNDLFVEKMKVLKEEQSVFLKISFKAEKDSLVYFNLRKSENIAKFKDNDYNQANLEENEMYDFGFVKAGEKKDVFIVLEDNYKIEDINSFILDYENSKKLCEKFKENDLNYSDEKNGYKISGNCQEEKKLIVFNPNINGMTYCLNGENKKATNDIGAFATFLVEGDILLSAKYVVPYKNVWIIATIIAILLISVILIVYKFTKFKWFERANFVLFSILIVGILSIFYLFGLFLAFFVKVI